MVRDSVFHFIPVHDLIHDFTAYVALRHYTLWDHRRNVIIALFVALAVTYIPVFVLGGLSIKAYYGMFSERLSIVSNRFMSRIDHTYYVEILDTCLVSVQPTFVKAFWGCMVSGRFGHID